MSECMTCEKPTPSGLFLCNQDADTLRRTLGRVRDVLNTAGGTLTNTAVAASQEGGEGSSREAPGMPYSLDMSEHVGEYQSCIRYWADQLGQATSVVAPLDTIRAAAFLLERIGIISGNEHAGQILTELRHAERQVINAADRQTPKLLLGECGTIQWEDDNIVKCSGQVIGREGDDQAKCERCHTTHSAHARQVAKLEEAHHVGAPLPTILRALKDKGYATIPHNRAEKWVSLGKLEHVTEDPQTGRKQYTIAAVLEAFKETPTGKRQHALFGIDRTPKIQ